MDDIDWGDPWIKEDQTKRQDHFGLKDAWTIKDHIKTGDHFGHWTIMDQENKLPLGKLRTTEQMPSPHAVEREIMEILQLAEGTPAFQQLINRELMGAGGETSKHSRDSDNTPPEPKKTKQGAKPARPTLQGAYPCYSWIKQPNGCKGTTWCAQKEGRPSAQVRSH